MKDEEKKENEADYFYISSEVKRRVEEEIDTSWNFDDYSRGLETAIDDETSGRSKTAIQRAMKAFDELKGKDDDESMVSRVMIEQAIRSAYIMLCESGRPWFFKSTYSQLDEAFKAIAKANGKEETEEADMIEMSGTVKKVNERIGLMNYYDALSAGDYWAIRGYRKELGLYKDSLASFASMPIKAEGYEKALYEAKTAFSWCDNYIEKEDKSEMKRFMELVGKFLTGRKVDPEDAFVALSALCHFDTKEKTMEFLKFLSDKIAKFE